MKTIIISSLCCILFLFISCKKNPVDQPPVIEEVNEGESNVDPLYEYPSFSTASSQFFTHLNLEAKGLEKVKAAVEKKDFSLAGQELYVYFVLNRAGVQKVFKINALTPGYTPQAEAETLLKRTYSFQGATHTFSNGLDWLYNPTGKNGDDVNPEWVANTVRFRIFPVLSQAYRATKDERYAAELIYLLKDFFTKFPVPTDELVPTTVHPDVNHLVYSKLSVSSRLDVAVLSLFSIIESPALKSEDFMIILKGIYNHMLRMEKFPYLDYHNMGVVDAEVLLKVAVAFPELKKSNTWTTWALQRGLDQMENTVYPDGVEKELCPRYHDGVMVTFLNFLTVAQDAGIAAPPKFMERLSSMAEFLVKISRPDGSLPAFNEMVQVSGNGADIRKRIRAMERAVNDKSVLQWFGSGGTSGTRPAYTSTALDWAGYYVMRSGWNSTDNYMAIKAGPYGTAHQHEDKLSFELVANGESFLIDPGFYTYNHTSPWRKYYLSSLAHNTVVPDRLTQFRYGQRGLYEGKSPNDALWISNSKYDFLSASYKDGYADYLNINIGGVSPSVRINHQRDILFIKPGVWLVLDWLDPEDTKQHLYEALFQSVFPVSNTNNRLFMRGAASNLYIVPVASFGKSVQASSANSQTDPTRRGWIYNVNTQQNTALPTGVISQTAVGSTVQAYFIVAEKGNPAFLNQVTTLNVAGGIGAKLTITNGNSVSFIAQKKSGSTISGGTLSTSGRIKVLLENANTEQFEIVN
jgi:hypothetical protein